MSTKQTEALKLALSVLDEVRSETFRLLRNGQKLYAEEKVWNAIFVIKQALAEQPAQQEPVAWITKNGKGWLRWHRSEDSDKNQDSIPLYTSPPASKPWVGLTQQDIDIAFDDTQEGGGFNEFARAIEAKLKEKNNG